MTFTWENPWNAGYAPYPQKTKGTLWAAPDQDVIGFEDYSFTTAVSKVSIVGAGMVTNPGVAAKMFEALYEAHINIHMIATSEIKVSVLIDEGCEQKAVKALHDKFELAL